MLEPLPPDPQPAEGKKGEHRRIRQGANSPEYTKKNPASNAAPLLQFERDQKNQAEDERSKCRVPEPVHRPIPEPGQQCPDARRPQRDAIVRHSLRNQVNRHAGKRRQQAVETQNHPRRGVGVHAEYLEHPSHEVGIKRRFPGGRSGVVAVRIAKALALRDGARDASHLPTEAEVIFPRTGLVLAENAYRGNLQEEGEQHQAKQVLTNGRGYPKPCFGRDVRYHLTLSHRHRAILRNAFTRSMLSPMLCRAQTSSLISFLLSWRCCTRLPTLPRQ